LVTEGAVSNVMVVQGGTVVTAPQGSRILSGITRAVVLDLARSEGLPVQERFVSQADVYEADEVFLTGTTVEVLAVIRVDGKVIGDGRPGPIAQRLATRFTSRVG
jgi:D-alanine transaminase